MKDTKPCPACGAKGCRAVNVWGFGRRPGPTPVGPCGACGWCRHSGEMSDYTAATGRCDKCDRPAAARRDWCDADHLPRPAAMPDDEFQFRARLFVCWKTEPASHLRRGLEVFADWLADRGSSEEVAARADWLPYANKKADPKGWYQWIVPAGKGWVEVERSRVLHPERWSAVGEFTPAGYRTVEVINDERARLTRSFHNGRWLLCWPPGFVRFTAPLSHDPTRWRVTVLAGRLDGSTGSAPIERVWPGGYTQLLLPFVAGAPKLVAEGGVIREPSPENEDLGLFRETEA